MPGAAPGGKLPRADPAAVARFERLCPEDPSVVRRKMFGQAAAFAQGQMFLGVFGAEVFVRLAEPDRPAALALPGARPFAPMAGRPMREYVVLPPAILDDPARGAEWVRRALDYARSLGPKRPPQPRR